MPSRPRFIRGLVVLPLAGETLVDGTDQLEVLRGESAARLLPDLISLMDGTRTLAEVESALCGVPAAHVRKAASLLMSIGLLEEGTDHTQDAPANAETLSFLRRFVGATGANRNGWEAYRKLTAAEVVVLPTAGASGAEHVLVDLLAASGVARVSVRRREELDRLGAGERRRAAGALVVSLCLAGEDGAWHRELDDWAHDHEVPWFRAVVDEGEGYADLGPLFEPEASCCYRCLQAVHSRGSACASPRSTRSPGAAAELWAGMVATEIVYALTRIGPEVSGRCFRRHDLRTWGAKDLIVPRLPGCPRCRPAGDEAGGAAPSHGRAEAVDTALVFEDCVGLESRPPLPPRAYAEIARLSGTLGRQAKSLPICEQHPLRAPLPALEARVLDALSSNAATPGPSFTVAELAAVLRLTAGFRDPAAGGLKRWAATAGNLGSVELFVAARNVDGLPPGLYFYEPREDALASVRWRSGGLALDELIERAMPDASRPRPDALVLLTGAFHRLARKYGPFAYRLLQLDAGAAVSQLHLVARSLRLWSRTAAAWTDDVIESQLGLDPPGEQSTAVVTLSRTGAARPEGRGGRGAPAALGKHASLRPVRSFFEMAASDVAALVHGDGRRTREGLAQGGFAVPPEVLLRDDAGLPLLGLPRPACGGPSVGSVLARRASLRRYAADPVRADQLATMLHHAHRGDVLDWPEEQGPGQGLAFMVLAWRVEGVPAGVYSYDPETEGLRAGGPVPPPEEMARLMVQTEFTAAPLQVWVVGNLAAACARHGAWGHRELLLRAGSACHRLWFAALGAGLGGAIVAGFVPGAARKVLALDGHRRAGLAVVAVGHEPPDALGAEPPVDGEWSQ